MRVRVIAPFDAVVEVEEILERLAAADLRAPFSDSAMACCAQLSSALFADSGARALPELQALAFWLRRAETRVLREEFSALATPGVTRMPRGTVFHIPPSNVDTMFVYSWALALLTGNRNVVRISTRESRTTSILCRLLREALPPSGQLFVQYGHDAHITSALSAICNVRVVWGGDETVTAIRQSPLPPRAKEIAFADRFSLSAISAGAWLGTAASEQERLAHLFFNDLFWFDQRGCSSPRLLVWCGEARECREAAAGFHEVIEREVARRGYHLDTGARMQKLVFAAGAIIDRPVAAYETHGPAVSVLELESLDAFDREHCGGGLLFQFHTSSLDRIVPVIEGRDQTLTYYGFARSELEALVRDPRLRGIDRIVPIGQALRFSHYWDGYDLFQELTRAVAVI